MEAIQPCLTAVVRKELLKHQDQDVKVLLATCFCEITRITAPEAPYSDDVLRTIFRLIVGTFGGLADVNSHYFSRRVAILETVARYRACVVMLDPECNDLITDMFRTFLEIVRFTWKNTTMNLVLSFPDHDFCYFAN
ncbi:sister chromatid cohesion protein PDS5-like [Triticum aestivum]|uniref:sister chromatid cohesion protein PDS5-like n=1 Tax=Triticum aestivum TaxID=4565 RepID=UPI001D0041F3|nr:sister chromatid cohesion protein PDS5-like [Triticum aestivum]